MSNYTLIVISEDETLGTVSGGGYFAYKASVTVIATPNVDCSFAGWYYGSNKVSSSVSYSFSMPSRDYSLTAKFKPNTLLYEMYPQTLVSDFTLISNLNCYATRNPSTGYYAYNNELYYSCTAQECEFMYNSSHEEKYTFEDGTPIIIGKKYWFEN